MKKYITQILKRIYLDYKMSKKSKWGSFWNYRKGFYKETIEICGITKQNYKDFLSNRRYNECHPINGAYSSLLDNKLWLPLLLKDHKELCPIYYYFLSKDLCFNLETNTRGEYDDLIKLLKVKGKLACKHTHSSLGVGFFVISFRNNLFSLNNKPITEEMLMAELKGLNEYIITEFIEQHKYANQVAPESLNTLRLLTVQDVKTKRSKVVRAFHRFGANNSIVDNIGNGSGVLVFVDTQKGICTGKGAVNLGDGNKLSSNIIHPNSSFVLKGLEIPYYEDIVSTILEIANAHPYLKYVGWDIAIANNGAYKIIETNSLSSLNVIQQQKGFMKDVDIKYLFE